MKNSAKSKKSLIMIFLMTIVLMQCQITKNVNLDFNQNEFEIMADEVSKGDVPDISATQLKKEKKSFIILDCREKNEFIISHIEGARRVGFENFDVAQIQDIPKDSKIVAYCTVGWRSERIGEKLQDAGYLHVNNLHGSLLSWMNEGYDVVDEHGKKTNKIHGYNRDFKFEKHCKTGEMVY